MIKIKQLIKLVVISGLIFSFVACQTKIYGARKHRKDRNCGCEMQCPTSCDDNLTTLQQY
ncbi:MAG TPA: hypothetical protein PKK66_06000 [Bacteroidales bacterium]|nr:hypothetical protein [Bacteroidales bacterium]HPT52871.1 hypothetical protein [Bacteroidales bacterium]